MADDAKMRQLDQLEEGQEPVEAKASPKVSYERTRNRLKTGVSWQKVAWNFWKQCFRAKKRCLFQIEIDGALELFSIFLPHLDCRPHSSVDGAYMAFRCMILASAALNTVHGSTVHYVIPGRWSHGGAPKQGGHFYVAWLCGLGGE